MVVSLKRGLRGSLMRVCAIALVVSIVMIPHRSFGVSKRRIGIALFPGFFLVDGEYFNLENAPSFDMRIRYELGWNVYFENRLGYLFSEQNGTSVGGFSYQLGVAAILPYLIPYRPIVNAGIGFLSVDPVTVTPTESFRPSQTTFYFVFGIGVARSIKENITVEAASSLWVSPYKYRIYRFNRSDVEIDESQFTHGSFHVGVSYIF